MDEAHRAGLRPCRYMDGEYRIEAGGGRSGWLMYRGRLGGSGRTRWELWLNDRTERVLSFWVDEFDAAAAAALGWVRGDGPADVLARANGHVIRGPAGPVAAGGSSPAPETTPVPTR